MKSVQYYCYSSFAWLGIQGLPLVIFPRFILGLLKSEYQPDTELEIYFARSLGLALLTLAFSLVVVCGGIPLTTSLSEVSVPPYANAVMLISTLHHASVAWYCYSYYISSDQGAFAFGALLSAFFATIGLGCFLFADDKSMVSKNLHLDKATSSFPFKNQGAYRDKKRIIRK
ncbi:hypothetical protein TD95_001828, partial [Thielaviopsis punctulata]